MKRAIQNSLYFTKVLPDYLQHPITSFSYDNKNSLKSILTEVNKSIEILTHFGNSEEFYASVLNELVNCYETLLLEKVSAIYLVNRKDISICLVNSLHTKGDNHNFVVIKLDSILSEYYKKSYSSLSLLTVGFLLGALSTFGYNNFSNLFRRF